MDEAKEGVSSEKSMGDGKKKESSEEIAQRFNVDLRKLEAEQKKLAKLISLKDSIDFSSIERVAGIENVFIKNKIISAVIVIDCNFEVIEQKYFTEKAKFPYIPGFRAYRELPAMISVLGMLEEKPDVIFVKGSGVLHSMGLGIASHLAIAANVPCIGVADSLNVGEIKGENILLGGKVMGKALKTKEGANPIYISPGGMISVKTAIEIAKKFTKKPHKMPEPLRGARKYARDVMKEMAF